MGSPGVRTGQFVIMSAPGRSAEGHHRVQVVGQNPQPDPDLGPGMALQPASSAPVASLEVADAALAAGGIFRFEDIDLGFVVIPGNIQAAIVALSLNEGAYMTEIIRAGILAVDNGQTEAAKSLGMTYFKLMRRIILPQAIRVIVPPLGNEFNAMLKNTTLVSVIGVPELLLATQMITSATFRVFELYTVVALYYLTLTTLWGFVQAWLERRYGEPSRSVALNPGLDGGLRKMLTRGEPVR